MENSVSKELQLDRIKKINTFVLISTNFLQGVGWGIFFTIYQIALLDYIPSETVLGFLISLMFLFQFAPMPFFGKLSDKIGRKPLILSGMVVPIISLGILGFANTLPLILGGMFLFFFGWSLRDPAFQSSMNENITGSKSGIIFSISIFCFFGGNLLGNLSVSLWSAEISHQGFFLLFGGLYILQFLLISLFYQDLPKAPVQNFDISPKENHSKSILIELLKKRDLRPLFLFFLVDSLIWSTGFMLFNGSLKSQLEIPEENVAFILMGYNIIIVCTQIPLGKIIDKIGTKRSIAIAELFGIFFFGISIIAAFLEGSTQIWVLFIGQCLFGFTIAFFFPAQMVVFTNTKKNRAAETYGAGSLMIGLGAFPATIIAGILIEKIHFIAPLVFAIIFIPINTLIFIKKYKEPNQSIADKPNAESGSDLLLNTKITEEKIN